MAGRDVVFKDAVMIAVDPKVVAMMDAVPRGVAMTTVDHKVVVPVVGAVHKNAVMIAMVDAVPRGAAMTAVDHKVAELVEAVVAATDVVRKVVAMMIVVRKVRAVAVRDAVDQDVVALVIGRKVASQRLQRLKSIQKTLLRSYVSVC